MLFRSIPDLWGLEVGICDEVKQNGNICVKLRCKVGVNFS